MDTDTVPVRVLDRCGRNVPGRLVRRVDSESSNSLVWVKKNETWGPVRVPRESGPLTETPKGPPVLPLDVLRTSLNG